MQTLSQPFYVRLLIIAALLHLCAAWFSLGHYQNDENYKVLDFAGHKAGYIPAEKLVWEYHEKTNSAILPSIAYGALQILPDNADAPFTAAFLVRLLSVILAFVASLAFFLAYQKDIKSEAVRRWVLAAMLLCWALLFYHARFSAENIMASFLLLAFALLRWNKFLMAGVLFGLAFVVRYQAGFILLPLGLWVLFILRPRWQDIATLAAGGVAVLLGGFLLDWWFYGEPVLPWVNYLQFHLGHSLPSNSVYANSDSVQKSLISVYYIYGGSILPPIGFILPFILAAFYVKFPRHPIVWATALYIAVLLFLHQRESRHAYLILVFMPYITAMVWQEVIEQRAALRRVFLWLLKITAAINMPLIAFAAFYPAGKEVKLLRDCILPNMQGGATAYHLKQGLDNIERRFYMPETTITEVADESELRERLLNSRESEALYITRKPRTKQLEENGITHTRLCSAIPEWVLQFNINNWTERSSSYPVYQVSLPSRTGGGLE